MRLQTLAATVATHFYAASWLLAAPGLVAVDGTIGKNLQTFASIRLSEPAPDTGLVITVTSDDPERLLLSSNQSEAGKASLELKLGPRRIESGDFWLQARADRGTVTYTASAPGYGNSKGTITLAPSGILITGPFQSPSFPTTSGADTSRLIVYSARLDGSGRYVDTQLVAGGLTLDLDVTSSDPQVGTILKSPVRITGGQSEATTNFKPASAGQTTLTVSIPPGFSAPAEAGCVKAIVSTPGLGISDELTLGKDLQMRGSLSLGQAAPEGGLTVTITSSDPSKLLIAASENEVGAKSITLTVPAGKVRGFYYLQALGDSGIAEYSASAPGYRSRVAPVHLTPSGVVLTYHPYGPPDEAEVLRPDVEHPVLGFVANVAPGGPSTEVAVWMVQLDPVTRRGADITVQHLRAGLSTKVRLRSSDPTVGSVAPEAMIPAGAHSAVVQFKPLRPGKTTLSVTTPPGFTQASNSTSLPVTVR